MSAMPSPPYPDPDSQMLGLILHNAYSALESGDVDTKGAILQAAVRAWFEGHIEGEDTWPGCDFRGELQKHQTRGWIDPEMN